MSSNMVRDHHVWTPTFIWAHISSTGMMKRKLYRNYWKEGRGDVMLRLPVVRGQLSANLDRMRREEMSSVSRGYRHGSSEGQGYKCWGYTLVF